MPFEYVVEAFGGGDPAAILTTWWHSCAVADLLYKLAAADDLARAEDAARTTLVATLEHFGETRALSYVRAARRAPLHAMSAHEQRVIRELYAAESPVVERILLTMDAPGLRMLALHMMWEKRVDIAASPQLAAMFRAAYGTLDPFRVLAA